MEPLSVDTNCGNNGSTLVPSIHESQGSLLMSVDRSQKSDKMYRNGQRELAEKLHRHVSNNGSNASSKIDSYSRKSSDLVQRSERVESHSSFDMHKEDHNFDDLTGPGSNLRHQKSERISRHNSINSYENNLSNTNNSINRFSNGVSGTEKGKSIRGDNACLNEKIRRGGNASLNEETKGGNGHLNDKTVKRSGFVDKLDVGKDYNGNGNISLGWSYVVSESDKNVSEKTRNVDLQNRNGKKVIHENCSFGSCIPEIVCDGNRVSLDPDHEHCRLGVCFVREALKYQVSLDTDHMIQYGQSYSKGDGDFKFGGKIRKEIEIGDESIGKTGNNDFLFQYSMPVSCFDQEYYDHEYLEEYNGNKKPRDETKINHSHPLFDSSNKRNNASDKNKKRSGDHHQRNLDSMDNRRNSNKNHDKETRSLKTTGSYKGSSYDRPEINGQRSNGSRSRNGQRSKLKRSDSESSRESAFREFRRNNIVENKQNFDLIQCMRDGMNFAENKKSDYHRTNLNGSYLGSDGMNVNNFPSKENDTSADNGFYPYMSLHGTGSEKNGVRGDLLAKQVARDERSFKHNLTFNKIDYELDQIRNRENQVFAGTSNVENRGDHSQYYNGANRSQSHAAEKDGLFRMAESEPSANSLQHPKGKSDIDYGQLDVMFKHVKNDQFQMVLVADEMNKIRRQEQEINTKIDRSVVNVSQQNRTIYDRESRVEMLEHKEMVRQTNRNNDMSTLKPFLPLLIMG